ncbi:DUF1570 domain-containing protein [Brevundimonas goettingensis]|uniref:DUF1570 domain-containing protein n=1 Tax=Brevundimonas goettingensis TaxID=2774190 RepID=A0A975C1Z5_9CAUL|nr:DUF1570 domain-containing protein [Brevundimonas goettingensis]QTC91559.1 DUF1570 domain-containing protein [Brevundimonas goettingensis]
MSESIRTRLRPVLACAASAAALLAMAAPAHAEWLRAETTHFVIYGDTNRGELQRYAQKLERFDALLRTYYPIRVDHEIPKLDIVLANGGSDMDRMSPGISSSVAGFYAPDSGRIFAVVNTRSEMDDVVIFHEYAHHFMFQMTSVAYPSWFVEGFAEYYAQADVRRDHIRIGGISQGRMNSLTGGSNTWAPTDDVLRWRLSRSGRYRGFDYYAQSWALAHYMFSDPDRTKKLGQYLALVGAGTETGQALQTSFGRTPAQLQDDLRRYLSGAIPVLSPQIQLPDAEVSITALPASWDRLVWFDFRLDRAPYTPRELGADATQDQRRVAAERQKEAEEEQRHLIRDATAAGDQFATDRMGILVKARAQNLAGSSSDAFETLEPLLTADSKDSIALRLGGQFLLDMANKETDATLKAGMMRQVRSYLSRALDADPLDFRTYLALDDSRKTASGYPNDNDLSTLQIAATLAPQSSDARLRTARAYMAHGLPALAIVMLTPVANDPHGGSGQTAVRALLAQARAAMGLSPTEDAPPPEEEGDDEGSGEGSSEGSGAASSEAG